MRPYVGTSHCVCRSVLNVTRKVTFDIAFMWKCFDLKRHSTPPHPQLRLLAVATVRSPDVAAVTCAISSNTVAGTLSSRLCGVRFLIVTAHRPSDAFQMFVR